jgi:glycine/D-amino acid oxidase-like deaminating enzyme/nitrite reductase/ring-hydroxylating ferredoxin subunit
MNTQSLWLDHPASKPKFPQLKKDISVDVAIVGGGICGITAALLLQRAGKKVAVLDMAHIGGGETGHTTAHLTEILDTRYHELISDFGRDGATQAAASSRASIEQIQEWISEYSIDGCAFERLPGYLFTQNSEDADELKKETEALGQVGISANLVDTAPLPFATVKAIEIQNQAQFQPYNYLMALAAILAAAPGCFVFENTRATEIQDGTPCSVTTEHGSISAQDVIVAANTPVNNWLFLHTKVAAYRSYALAARVSSPLSRGLFWDTADPYHYIRGFDDDTGSYIIIGGEDHKTGTRSDTEDCFGALEAYTRQRFTLESIPFKWSGQIMEPADGLPYIGLNSLSKHTYVATGFSGNGMTFGTLAGMLITDQIIGIQNSWQKLYDATRIHPFASAVNFVSENKDFPRYFVGDRIAGADANSAEAVRAHEGKIVTIDGEKCAVHRDAKGTLHTLSAVCPHMGCIVHWNNAEQTWDCPCHGSRFDGEGKLINGPALSDLKAMVAAKR